jgi:alkanesulfonate monooxygenase SsuD/methylene tetrahydromethanopterin reductase-like flavin-dependent oxidoreductase (luciferase family)
MVSPVTFRPPAVLAKAVITADHVSGGRVELGMGAGWHEAEHRNWGFPFPPVGERVGMLEEQVQIVHRLMSKDDPRVSFEGRFYRLEDCPALPKPVQDPHVPLILGGGGGPRVSRLAARFADEYNTAFKTPQECRDIRGRLDAACEEVGRDPATLPMSLMTGFAIGATTARAAERATMAGALRGLPAGDDPVEALGEAYVAGTPERVMDRLARFAEAGITRVMLQHLMQDDLDSVALVGTDVIPAAASL